MSSRPAAPTLDDFDSDDDYDDAAPSGQDRSMQTKRLLLGLVHRWYWIVLCLILGGLGAVYYLSKAPKQYAATSSLLIKQQTSSVMSGVQVDEIDMRSAEGLNTVAEKIRRHDLLERVAARMDVRALPGLIPPPVDWMPEWSPTWLRKIQAGGSSADNETAAAKTGPPAPAVLGGYIASWMKISIRRGTRLLDITIQHPVPEVAKALADAVAREYLAEIAGAITEGRSSQSETLIKQSEEARAALHAAESALASYVRALGVHQALEAQEKVNDQLERRYKPKHPKMAAAISQLKELKDRFLEEFAIAVASPADAAYWKTSSEEIEASKNDQDAQLRLARQFCSPRRNCCPRWN